MLTAILALVLQTSSPAQEKDVQGWSDTKWGMTEDQVLGVLGPQGGQRVANAKEDRLGRIGAIEIPSLKIGVYEFKVSLKFKDGGLMNVILSLLKRPGASYPGVKTMLIEKYGPPASETREMGRQAQWNFPSTVINLTEMPLPDGSSMLSLSYNKPRDLNKL
jgi:hypothetical protein